MVQPGTKAGQLRRLLNIIFSMISRLTQSSSDNAGRASVTGLISSTLLILPHLGAWWMLARTSWKKAQPLSMFARLPVLPNTIDKDYRFKDGASPRLLALALPHTSS